MAKHREFLTWFYEQYAAYLYKKAWELCADGQDIDDVVQTVWEKLIPKEHVLRELEKPQQLNYICTTLKNTIREEARKKKLSVCSLETVQWHLFDQIADIDEAIDRENRDRLFREAWELVNPDVRELLERKYELEQSDEEIAQAMGIKPSSVRMYITRAKRATRKLLADYKDIFIR